MTPSLRDALSLPSEFDISKSFIQIWISWDTRRFVKVALPQAQFGAPPEGSALHERVAISDYYDTIDRVSSEQASALWQSKYSEPIPLKDVENPWAETLLASVIPHEGRVTLTEDEQAVVDRADEFGDFTLDMLWLMVEGLGWRPGKPVAEDDPGWAVIWDEEVKCAGYVDIVRAVLGMPGIDQARYEEEIQNRRKTPRNAT